MIDENYKHIFVQDIDKPKHDGGAIESTKSDKADNTGKSTVSQVVNFSASPMDLFECLTDINRIEAWSRCAAELSAVPGGLFNLLNGRISGKFQELIPGEKIVQKWRLNSWDADHYSKVSITIAPSDTGSTLTVTQSSIPSGHHSSMSENWSRFYWWPIRDTFGFGCTIE